MRCAYERVATSFHVYLGKVGAVPPCGLWSVVVVRLVHIAVIARKVRVHIPDQWWP